MKIKVSGKPVKLRINGILSKLPNIKIPLPELEWSSTTLPTAEFYSWGNVAYSGDRFIAFSKVYKETPRKIVLYSFDGISWNHLQLPTSSKIIEWSNFAYGNGKFVVCAHGYIYNIGEYVDMMYDNTISYSSDGISWQIATLPFTSYSDYVVYGNGKFLLNETTNNYLSYSEDGVSWEQIESPFRASYAVLFFGNGKFIELGENNAACSDDGITWAKTTLPFSATWKSCTYGNGKFLAIGRDSSKARTVESLDGITWVEANNNLGKNANSVAYDGERFLAASYDVGKTWESEDGSEWKPSIMPPELEGPGSQYVSVAYGNNRFVALPYGGNRFAYTNFDTAPQKYSSLVDHAITDKSRTASVVPASSSIGEASIGTATIA